MSSKPAVYILGQEIQAFPSRISYDPPAHVRVHKLGEPRNDYYTPDEARAFAAALVEAANAADNKE